MQMWMWRKKKWWLIATVAVRVMKTMDCWIIIHVINNFHGNWANHLARALRNTNAVMGSTYTSMVPCSYQITALPPGLLLRFIHQRASRLERAMLAMPIPVAPPHLPSTTTKSNYALLVLMSLPQLWCVSTVLIVRLCSVLLYATVVSNCLLLEKGSSLSR